MSLIRDLFGSAANDAGSSAVISECGRYRYKLSRRTSVTQFSDTGKRAVWVMLNPSTADATTNDRTIEAVLDFSARWLCTHVDVVNMYAFRATDPSELWKAADPVGPDNNYWIMDTCYGADLIVCAWGGNAAASRITEVEMMLPRPTWALARNKDGTPKHPLYIRRDTKPVRYP